MAAVARAVEDIRRGRRRPRVAVDDGIGEAETGAVLRRGTLTGESAASATSASNKSSRRGRAQAMRVAASTTPR